MINACIADDTPQLRTSISSAATINRNAVWTTGQIHLTQNNQSTSEFIWNCHMASSDDHIPSPVILSLPNFVEEFHE